MAIGAALPSTKSMKKKLTTSKQRKELLFSDLGRAVLFCCEGLVILQGRSFLTWKGCAGVIMKRMEDPLRDIVNKT